MINKTTWFCSILPLLFSVQLFAADRIVNAGASIQTQINNALPGDKVRIHAGTYSQSFSINNKSNLIIERYGDGDVIINGDGSTPSTIYIQNGNNITIQYLTIKNIRKAIWSAGITIEGSGSGFTINNNIITEISYVNKTWDAWDNPGNTVQGANGIIIAGTSGSNPLSNINVLNNEVSYCITGWNEGLALKGNISNYIIDNNRVHHITNIGIDVLGLSTYPNITTNNQPRDGVIKNNTVYNCICNYTDNGGIYVDGAMSTTICNNKVYLNKYGITLGCENQINKPNAESRGLEVRNNFIYNNSRPGIMCGSKGVNNGSDSGKITYSNITGNTLVKNSSGSGFENEITIQNANNIGCYNNILYGRYQKMFVLTADAVSLSFRANYYYNPSIPGFVASRETQPNIWTDVSFSDFKNLTGDTGSDQSVLGDPKITSSDENNPNPHLLSNSPCINAGKTGFSALAGEKDYDGQDRIQGTKVDIGVDETATAGGTACPVITVDGVLSDWSGITAIATASSQSTQSLKAANSTQTLWFAISGSGMDATNYQIFLNTDNNTATGYADNQYTSSGADYMIENGVLYKHNGGSAWGWTAVNTTIQVFKSASVKEIGMNRSAFTSLASVIKVAYKDINASYNTLSKLPAGGTYASYTILNCQ